MKLLKSPVLLMLKKGQGTIKRAWTKEGNANYLTILQICKRGPNPFIYFNDFGNFASHVGPHMTHMYNVVQILFQKQVLYLLGHRELA
jgi:hypothetical protein